MIIAAPHSSFVDRWLASYETFDEHEWDDHSVNIPWVSGPQLRPSPSLVDWADLDYSG